MVATRTEPGRDDRAAVDKAFSLLVAFGDDDGAGRKKFLPRGAKHEKRQPFPEVKAVKHSVVSSFRY